MRVPATIAPFSAYTTLLYKSWSPQSKTLFKIVFVFGERNYFIGSEEWAELEVPWGQATGDAWLRQPKAPVVINQRQQVLPRLGQRLHLHVLPPCSEDRSEHQA